ncbi:MAG: hypothetical protein C0518_05860 [Opitutus sp.]|nr:hypothetical protein [Opitutus sp.]
MFGWRVRDADTNASAPHTRMKTRPAARSSGRKISRRAEPVRRPLVGRAVFSRWRDAWRGALRFSDNLFLWAHLREASQRNFAVRRTAACNASAGD